MEPSKQERLEEFCRRLSAAPAPETAEEAFSLIAETLNEVEDELTTIPNNPEQWRTDGRLYPPQADSARTVEGQPGTTRYRSRGHNTFVSENGAIEIQSLDGDVIFQKHGADGQGVSL
ncbi:MAG: hypothetical protein JKY65_11505 [Planctomycetes bacterium]|nr:hypothetical protein [Planctomycetota bacterium]